MHLRGYLSYESRAKRQEAKLLKKAEKEKRRAKLRAGVRKQEVRLAKYKKAYRPKAGAGLFSGIQSAAGRIQMGARTLEGTRPRKKRKAKKRRKK